MLTAAGVDFAGLRTREYARLDATGVAYLDYTGAALYAASHVRAHHAQLAEGLFGNPHAEHGASLRSAIEIEQARTAVLEFFGVDARTHAVCFTANTTAAVKLVAEGWPFGPAAPLALTADNHNSVNGLREFARRNSAPVTTLPLGADLRLDDPSAHLARAASHGRGLFAFPAQSNFSGVQHPLSLVEEARALGFAVLLDAAAFVPTNPLDLRSVPADFVALSFYKLFGYPTGVGALVATHEALARLSRPGFSGGTVDFVSVQHGVHQLRTGAESFEDGTPNYLGISAVPPGLSALSEIGLHNIRRHVSHHTQAFISGLTALAHRGREPLAEVYGPHCATDRGATVAFNIKSRTGRAIPYPIVEGRARQQGVAIRGGCFCNPGAAECAFRFDANRTAHCLQVVSDGFSIERFASCLGDDATVGALRASFGVPTNVRDVHRALELVASFAE
jgi:selenocysteine lyase/cysteine desulfurase